LLDDNFTLLAHPSGLFTLKTPNCHSLLPIFGRRELHTVTNIGNGITVCVDLELVQRSRFKGLGSRRLRRVQPKRRVHIEDDYRLGRISRLGERVEIGHV
jgi:hypothetical protein